MDDNEDEVEKALTLSRVAKYNESVTHVLARAVIVEMAFEDDPRSVPDLEKLAELLRRSSVISSRMLEVYKNRMGEILKAVENLIAQESLGID